MTTSDTERPTVAEVLGDRQSEVVETWMENIRVLEGTRTLDLMTEAGLRTQAINLIIWV